MIQRKICLLGAYAVGKTSLVRRFVHSVFSDKYQTTIGVKIDHKEAQVDGKTLNLVLWDLAGEDKFHSVETSYLKGSAGYLLVADGCRPDTLDQARMLDERARATVGDVPRILAINKADLADEWTIDAAQLSYFEDHGILIHHTSAKSGDRVEQAFQELAKTMLER